MCRQRRAASVGCVHVHMHTHAHTHAHTHTHTHTYTHTHTRVRRDKAVILASALAPAIGSVLILMVGYMGKLIPIIGLRTSDEIYVIQTGR